MSDTDSIRETLRESIQEAKAAESASVEATVPASDDSGGGSATDDAGTGGDLRPGDASQNATDGGGDKSPAVRTRDASGKFVAADKTAPKAPKQGAPSPTKAPVAAEPSPTEPPKPAEESGTPPPQLKAPQTWSASAREEFAKAPKAVQEEIVRRDKEMGRVLRDNSQLREFQQAMAQVAGPYAAHFQASGIDPMAAIGDGLKLRYVMTAGPKAQRAAMIVDLYNQAELTIDELAAALDRGHQPTSQEQSDPRAIFQEEFGKFMKGLQSQRQDGLRQRAAEEWPAFMEANEFAYDLQPTMRGLLGGGLAKDYKDAYEQALVLERRNPRSEIAKILSQREAAEAAKAAAANVQRSRGAATSAKSHSAPPRPPPSGGNATVRDDIREVIEEKRRAGLL